MLKTKKPLDEAQLKQIQGVLKTDLNGPLLELLQWINTIGSAIPKKNLYKSPFFDSQDIKEFNPWRALGVAPFAQKEDHGGCRWPLSQKS